MMGITDVKKKCDMLSAYHNSFWTIGGITVALLNGLATSGEVLDFVMPVVGLRPVTLFMRKHKESLG